MINSDAKAGKAVCSLLLTLGFQSSIAGFGYLCRAVFLYKSCHASMIELCEKIGKEYGKTATAIERDIGTAIKNAHARGWLVRLNDVIGINYIHPKKTVRIKGFIAILSDFMSNPEFISRVLAERLDEIRKREAYDIVD